jgi:dTMP kinase
MRFLAFEGLDGSGKSTLIQGLKTEFEKQRLAYIITREPGGSSLGTEVRHMLQRKDGEAPVGRAEALLFQADRAQHVEKVIKPALAQNKWVLSDRFAASSLAFQAAGRDIKSEDIEWLNRFSTAGLQPDLYVLLDLSVEESAKRMAGRGLEADRFESEGKGFHQKVRDAYLRLAKADPGRWLVLSASEKPEQLFLNLLKELRGRKWLA